MSEDLNLSCKSVQHRLATQWGYVKVEEVAAEREACAKVCEEDLCDAYLRQGKPARDEAMLCAAIADCANAIRARGEK